MAYEVEFDIKIQMIQRRIFKMGLFKVLGGVAIGVGAIAAAPFTGGGSILGAATLVGSLTGAGALAV